MAVRKELRATFPVHLPPREEKTATTTQAKIFVNEDIYKESCSPNLLFWMSCSTVFPIAPTTCGPAAHTLVVIASIPCGTEETERKGEYDFQMGAIIRDATVQLTKEWVHS